MKSIAFLMTLIVAAAAAPAFAATEADFSKSFAICCDKAGSDIDAMVECDRQELAYQDKLLNQYYREALKTIDDVETQKMFKDAQRAWLKTRDLDYEVTRRYTEPLNAAGHILEATIDRANYLKFIANP